MATKIKTMAKRSFRSESGMATFGFLFASFLALGVFLLLFEFYRIYTIVQNVDIELSRAVNIAVDLSMMDEYRRDRELVLDVDKAYESFYSYLHSELKLDGNHVFHDKNGKAVFRLEISDLAILAAPPGIRARAHIELRPTYFGNFYLDSMRFPVGAASQNRRID